MSAEINYKETELCNGVLRLSQDGFRGVVTGWWRKLKCPLKTTIPNGKQTDKLLLGSVWGETDTL